MRNVGLLLPTLAVLSGLATSTPNILAPFYQPLLHNFFGVSNGTASAAQELRRRQYDPTACPSGYGVNCAGLGNAALCCPDNAVCSADYLGNVACCPVGAACTGSVTETSTTAVTTTTTGTSFIGGVGVTSTTSTQSFIFASSVTTTTTTSSSESSSQTTAAGGGVIINPGESGTSGAASGSLATVPNPYFPIAVLPSTYASADACSRAYSTCQSDIAGCSSALAGLGVGVGSGGGITINAPNGGTTVLPVTTSFASAQASSICASLSTAACGTFSVQQCSVFGSGNGQGSQSSQGAAAGQIALRGSTVVHIVYVAVVLLAA